ncbi:MAG: DUF1080 domain-containing protein [Verrucomicrobiota bacterium]
MIKINLITLKRLITFGLGVIILSCSREKLVQSPSEQEGVIEELHLLSGPLKDDWERAAIERGGSFHITEGVMKLEVGEYMSGVTWKGELPARIDYEIELEARRTGGQDIFLGLTIPVGPDHCSWICGGWGGDLVGISNLDEMSAADNDTTNFYTFEEARWYHCRIRVRPDRIRCWIDGEVVVDVDITGREISMFYSDIEETVPFGLATYDAEAEYRNLIWRTLEPSQ